MKSIHILATLALGLAAPIACAHGAGKLVNSGVQGGVEGGLQALNDPRNKELLLRLLRDPEIVMAAHDLTAALTGGAIDGLSDEQRVKRVQAASDAYIRTVAAAIGDALDQDLSPALARGVGDVVAEALRPANRRLAQDMIGGVTRSALAAFSQASAQGLRDDLGPALTSTLIDELGPALQRVIEDNLGPALRKVLEQDLQVAMQGLLAGEEGGATGAFARALTKQIVLGVNDGMSEMGISPSPNAKDATRSIGWLPITLGVLLLLLCVVVARMFFTRRALARDRARSEQMLVEIMRALKASESEAPGARTDLDAVLARVQRQQRPELDAANAYLAAIVGRAHLPPTTRAAATNGPAA